MLGKIIRICYIFLYLFCGLELFIFWIIFGRVCIINFLVLEFLKVLIKFCLYILGNFEILNYNREVNYRGYYIMGLK